MRGGKEGGEVKQKRVRRWSKRGGSERREGRRE